jgi:hypothetical protein
VELLMALSITAMTGAAIAALFSAVDSGTTAGGEMRSLLVKTHTLDARINSAVRGARQVLYPNTGNPSSTDYIIIWTADLNGDSAPQNNEVRLIERRTNDSSVHEYANPADTATYPAPATFRSTAIASYPSKRLSQGVTSLTFTATTQATSSALVSYRFTMREGDTKESCVGAAAVRN